MVHFMKYTDNLLEFCKGSDKKVVLYGTGLFAKAYASYIPRIEFVCDTYASGSAEFMGKTVISPKRLEEIGEELIIVICVKSRVACKQMKSTLEALNIEAYVFDFIKNIAFNCYCPDLEEKEIRKLQYVRLVCYEEKGWIIRKFADNLKRELEKRGIRATMGNTPDAEADINHHIESILYEPIKKYIDTVMITHVLHKDSYEQVLKQMETARMGICMSRQTMNQLARLGIPREKLCYVNPAHDGKIQPKKYVLGITHRNYKDNRKRKGALIDICTPLNPDFFEIKIMGAGWEKEVEILTELGFTVEYFSEFDYEQYGRLLQATDFYLFWGWDEGSMGYLDAVAVGAETLVCPQGFHLDVKDGITYSCRTIQDFSEVLLQKQEERRKRIESVRNWSWEAYTDKHIKIWKYILNDITDEEFYENQHLYEDGEFSIYRYRSIWSS